MKNENGNWIAPGQLAVCRNIVGGDLCAGVLLYRLCGLWIVRKKKLNRHGREWLAMSRADWARSAGLTEAEIKNRALPILKKECAAFIEVRTMRVSPTNPNTLWLSLDWEGMTKNVMPWDMYEMQQNGQGIFLKKPLYPYKKDAEI